MKQLDALDRIFLPKDLFRGLSLRSNLWSFVSTVLLCIQMLGLVALTDLLHHGGRFELTEANREFAESLGEDVIVVPPLEDLAAGVRSSQFTRLDNTGLLPLVSWSQSTVFGPVTRLAYTRIPLLRDTGRVFPATIVVIVLIGLARGLALNRARILADRTALDLATRQRQAIHRQTLRLGPSDVADSHSDAVLELFTSQVDRVRDGIQTVIETKLRDPLMLLLLAALAVTLHWQVALQCLIPAAFCWYLIHREHDRRDESRKLVLDRADHELRLLSESLRKTRLVRGYGMEQFEQEQFELHAERFRDKLTRLIAERSWVQRFERFTVMACVAIILYLLGIKVLLHESAEQSLSFAALAGIIGCLVAMRPPLERVWNRRARRSQAVEAADRISRYMNQIPEVGQAVGARFLQPLSRALHFESVHYTLADNRQLLSGFDLKVDVGMSLALVSVDPLQAQAAAYMLPRFIEPQTGRILFDGEDTAWVTLESLRAETIFVGGADPFFTGTVSENISCGNSRFSSQEITEAAKKTHANHFILRLPQGYETVLGEHGESLAPGEAFRLGLARAILRDPAVLIIEEPRESLDEDTKSLLDDAYTRILKGRTVFFLPSRLSTLKRVDRIVLINNGKVEAIGSHTALLKSSELYRHWEYSNFNAFRPKPAAIQPDHAN